jgi:hypothetical protein
VPAQAGLALRPQALAVAKYIAAGVRAIAPAGAPLRLTAATNDLADQRAQVAATAGLAESDPIDDTGYTFEIARHYSSGPQAHAFQFMLDRLTALDVIAWQRGSAAIRIVVGPRAAALGALRFGR